MHTDYSKKKCADCNKGALVLDKDEILQALATFESDWSINDANHLSLKLKFPNFKAALAFCNTVGEIAETEGHHPDIQMGWGYVRLELWTHKAYGITEADIIFAAKVAQLLN